MKRVLVVEDEPAVADVIEFALRKAGFDVVIGPLCLNRVAFRATLSNQAVPLTKTEFELLWVLCESPGRVFSRDGLVARAYQGTRVSERTVDSHIKGIRQKCLTLAGDWDPIETVYGVGYKARSGSESP